MSRGRREPGASRRELGFRMLQELPTEGEREQESYDLPVMATSVLIN